MQEARWRVSEYCSGGDLMTRLLLGLAGVGFVILGVASAKYPRAFHEVEGRFSSFLFRSRPIRSEFFNGVYYTVTAVGRVVVFLSVGLVMILISVGVLELAR